MKYLSLLKWPRKIKRFQVVRKERPNAERGSKAQKPPSLGILGRIPLSLFEAFPWDCMGTGE